MQVNCHTKELQASELEPTKSFRAHIELKKLKNSVDISKRTIQFSPV